MRITYYANWTVTISSGNKVTYSYKKNNVQLKIKKYIKEKGEKETPEANAVFAVLDTSKITKKDLESLNTQKARQEYVAGSKALLGTITTDAKGEGTYTVTKDNGNKELTYGKTYTLLQTAGDSRYSLADAADVIINNTLSERAYAYSFVDTNACVLLKYKLDARTGEKTPEKGTEFEITQLSSGKKDDAAEATTATDTAAEGTTADASGETKGDTGETQPAFPMTVTTNEAGIVEFAKLVGIIKIYAKGRENEMNREEFLSACGKYEVGYRVPLLDFYKNYADIVEKIYDKYALLDGDNQNNMLVERLKNWLEQRGYSNIVSTYKYIN